MSAPAAVELVVPGDAHEDEWLAARRLGIGASDVGPILGLSKWAGPLTVWHSKLSGYDQPETDPMGIGKALEPWIVGKFTRTHPDLYVTARPGMFRDAARPWRMVTPDAEASADPDRPANILFEAKTASRWADDAEQGWGEPGSDEIPFPYLCQVTYGCAVLGYRQWWLGVLFDGHEYREYRGDYSPDLGAQMLARVDDYWHRHVVAGVAPRADGLDATRRLLVSLHTAPAKSVGQLPAAALDWQATYHELSAQLKETKEQRDELANLLRQAHTDADAEIGRVGSVTVSTLTRTKTGSVRLDVKGPAK